MSPRVTDAPAEIWLVYGDIELDSTHRECCASGEVTWCEDSQFESDVRYVRGDVAQQADAELTKLRAECERLRAALDKIAERTGSDDPCRRLVDIARAALTTGDAT